MNFADLVVSLKAQLTVVGKSPAPFLVVLAIIGFALWKVIGWYFSNRIADLESRLKLREDEISYLKRLAEQRPTTEQVSGTTTASLNGKRMSPSNIYDDEFLSVTTPNPLPWQLYVPPRDREFVQFEDVTHILESRADATSARQAALLKPYLKKWVRINVSVHDVDSRDDETCLSSLLSSDRLIFLWMHFTKDRDDLVHLVRGDEVALVGWIEEVRASGVRLYGCERVPL